MTRKGHAMRTIVYVSCADDKVVHVLEMNAATGALQSLSSCAVPGTAEPSASSLPLAPSPDRRFLYAALRTAPFPVCSFAIDPASGALALRGTAALPDSMCYLSVDQTGTRLFSASYGGSKLAVSRIRDGVVAEVLQVVATPPKAHSIRPDPSNRFVYAACLGGDVVLRQRLEGGLLDPTAHPAAVTRPRAGPRHFAFARSGRMVYVVNELDGSINAYQCDPDTGTLSELQTITLLQRPATTSVAAADIHLTPDERFLYASERTTNTLAAFRVDPDTGKLALIGHFPSEATPRGFAIEPQGRFLLCAGLASGRVATYRIDPVSGRLERMGAADVGAGPNWIEIVVFDEPG